MCSLPSVDEALDGLCSVCRHAGGRRPGSGHGSQGLRGVEQASRSRSSQTPVLRRQTRAETCQVRMATVAQGDYLLSPFTLPSSCPPPPPPPPLPLSSYVYQPSSLHSRLLSVLESLDNGKSIRESRDCDIPLVARHFYHHAGRPHTLTTPTRTYPLRHTGWAQLMETEMQGWASIGVVAAIVPWNFPLMLLTWKVTSSLNMSYDGHVLIMMVM